MSLFSSLYTALLWVGVPLFFVLWAVAKPKGAVELPEPQKKGCKAPRSLAARHRAARARAIAR